MSFRHRWTMKELEEKNDCEILLGLVQERQSDITNPYTPFAQRLDKINAKLHRECNKKKGRCCVR